MDMSSELIHSLLPVFMVSVLGASMLTAGIIEGVAEATASVAKVFSGALSDYLGRRKLLMVLGYGLARYSVHCWRCRSCCCWPMTFEQ
jgi:nitrate/nitrite transporter NarK